MASPSGVIRGGSPSTAPRSRSSRSASASRSGFGASNQSNRHRVANAPGMEREDGAGEVDAVDLGLLELRAATMLALGPEPNARPRPGPAGPARALIGRGATDPDRLPAVDSPSTIVADGPRQSAVDDRRHAVDRERGLRNVRAQDDFATVAWPQRAILLFGRTAIRAAAARRHPARAAAGSSRLRQAPYLRKSRQKNEQMALNRVLSDSRSSIRGTICSASAGRLTGRYCTDTSCNPPSTRAIGQPSR